MRNLQFSGSFRAFNLTRMRLGGPINRAKGVFVADSRIQVFKK